MRLRDVLKFAASNLWRRKLRSFLTIVGVTVGAAAIVLMVSFGIGLKRTVLRQFEFAELLTQITVSPVKHSLFSFDFESLGGKRKPLNDEVVRRLSEIEGVAAVYPDANAFVTVEFEGKKQAQQMRMVEVDGLPKEAITTGYRAAIEAGSFWNEDDAKAAVVPSSLLEWLGIAPAEDLIGKEIRITPIAGFGRPRRGGSSSGEGGRGEPSFRCWVTGVYRSERLGLAGNRIYLPQPLAVQVWRASGFGQMDPMSGEVVAEGEYRALTVKVAGVDKVSSVRKEIDALGYGTLTLSDIVGAIEMVFLALEAVLGSVGAIGLVVAFFGIANTMVMAILERTKEIGVMKALGARNRDIRRIFLAEAALIGIAGGCLGVFSGQIFGFVLDAVGTRVVSSGQAKPESVDLFYVSLALALGAVAFSTAVSMLAGIVPAIRAARLDPVAALRHE